jgi:hypothetical protein
MPNEFEFSLVDEFDQALREKFDKPEQIVACARCEKTGLVVGLDRRGHLAFVGVDAQTLRRERVLAEVAGSSPVPAVEFTHRWATKDDFAHVLSGGARGSTQGAFDQKKVALRKVVARLRRHWQGPFPKASWAAATTAPMTALAVWLGGHMAVTIEAAWKSPGVRAEVEAKSKAATAELRIKLKGGVVLVPGTKTANGKPATHQSYCRLIEREPYDDSEGSMGWLVSRHHLPVSEFKIGRRWQWSVRAGAAVWQAVVAAYKQHVKAHVDLVQQKAALAADRRMHRLITRMGEKAGNFLDGQPYNGPANSQLHVHWLDNKGAHELAVLAGIELHAKTRAASLYVLHKLDRLMADLRRLEKTQPRVINPDRQPDW